MSKVLTAIPAQGLEIRTADQLQGPQSCLIADNADLRLMGAARKLPGYRALDTGAFVGGFELSYRGDELVGFADDGGLYSRDVENGVWDRVATVPHGQLRILPQAAERGNQRNATVEVRGDFALSAWLTDDAVGQMTLSYSVQRLSDGRVEVAATTVATLTTSNVRGQPVVASTATGFVFAATDDSNVVQAWTVTLESWQQSGPFAVGTTTGQLEDYAIDRYSPGGVIVAHIDGLGGGQVLLTELQVTTGIVRQQAVAGTPPTSSLRVTNDDPEYEWTNETGIMSGLGVFPQGPPSALVDVQAGSVRDGAKNIASTTQTSITTTVDYLGNSTFVFGVGNERWISVLFGSTGGVRIVQGAQAAAGTAQRPPFETVDLVLADILLTSGGGPVTAVDTTRRQTLALMRPRIAVSGLAAGPNWVFSLYDSAFALQGATQTALSEEGARVVHAAQRGNATVLVERNPVLTIALPFVASINSATLDYTVWLTARTAPSVVFDPFVATGTLSNAALSHQPRYSVDGSTLWLWYFAGAITSASACYLLADFYDGTIHARAYEGNRAAPGTAGTNLPVIPNLPHMRLLGDVLWSGANYRENTPDRTAATSQARRFVDAAIGLLRWEEHDDAVHPESERGRLYWAPAGFVAIYDGREVFELGWHTLPEVTTQLVGGSLAAGTYGYAVYWVYEDRDGNLDRSGPFQTSVTLAGPGAVELTVYGAPPTARTGVRIGVARTESNGSVYYEILDPTIDHQPVPGGTVTIVDSASDASIRDNTIYDQAGDLAILPNDPTPAAGFVVALRDRIWFGDPEVPELVHFSLPFADGFVFMPTPSQVLGLTTGGERVNAMAEQDGTFYGLSLSRVSYFGGPGPDARGVGPQFGPAVDLRATRGTPNQRQVASTASNVWYGTARGPRVIGRDRASVSPFAQVNEAFRYQGQTISALLYDPGREETYIYSPQAAQPLGIVAWSPRTLRYAHPSQRWSSEPFADAVATTRALSGDVAFLRASDRRACIYTPGSFERDTHRGSLVVGTAHLRVGHEREMMPVAIGLKGRYLSDHKLRVGIAYNDDDAICDVYEIDPNCNQVRQVPQWQGDVNRAWSGGLLATDPENSSDDGGWGESGPYTGQITAISRYHFRIYLAPGAVRSCFSARVVVWDIDGDAAAYALTLIELLVEPGTEQLMDISPDLSYGSGNE